MTDYDFRVTLKKIKRAIIPVGSLEQHGAHLPVSTDSLIAEYLARLLAQKVGAFVLPVISYGVSFEHKPMFNVSLRNSTLNIGLCSNETPYEMTGRTNAPTFCAKSLARYSAISESVDTGKWAPCCSRDPTGIIARLIFLSVTLKS